MFHMLNSRMVRIDTYCLMVSDWQTWKKQLRSLSVLKGLDIWRFGGVFRTLKSTELESTSFFSNPWFGDVRGIVWKSLEICETTWTLRCKVLILPDSLVLGPQEFMIHPRKN
jgi:hypothetical protein